MTLLEENLTLLEENWKDIQHKVILPLWNGKFKGMYESVKLDYDDFESLAGLEMSKAIKCFDPVKSNIFTYATQVISKKALTELRNCTHRDKRKALYVADSLDLSIGDHCSYTTRAETLPHIDDKDKENSSELSELRVSNFINSLNNNQLRVLILSLLDFDTTDMPTMLNVSSKTASQIIRSLKDTDLTRVLYRRKF